MDTFASATALVALAEMGDKTQLLALLLVARFKRPWPIVAGIFLATVANHALAALLGAWGAQHVGAQVLRWLLAASFFAMAVWMLVPDKLDDAALGAQAPHGALSVLLTTAVAFFVAEMGDKTQVATVVLAAQHASGQQWLAVVAGTTLGMMLANVPVVLLGQRLMAWLGQGARLAWAHRLCAVVLVLMGLAVLL